MDQMTSVGQWGPCAYVIVYGNLPPSQSFCRYCWVAKPKWLPLNFGFNDVMRTASISPSQAVCLYVQVCVCLSVCVYVFISKRSTLCDISSYSFFFFFIKIDVIVERVSLTMFLCCIYKEYCVRLFVPDCVDAWLCVQLQTLLFVECFILNLGADFGLSYADRGEILPYLRKVRRKSRVLI